ncbi:MAG: bifunctional UDP-N-acetylglucosamine diphosphorylase/glucosamine-1-phosphate N-acetyltransferase GlmU [Gammaproteobacteria bacterium]|nr:bifunctional UDP-N-acetylglucosamine diphosphorylase/glucosamine-1-phosphate N-acetyltransferase GlmU [Gammaproteobacteria bacterium]
MQGPLSPLEIVILAAGQGRRMASARPKVLHTLAGRPLLAHVLETARSVHPQAIHVVYGHGGELVRAAFAADTVSWVLQAERRGTGDALRQALPAIAGEARVLVLLGDVPLLTPATVQALLDTAPDRLTLLTFLAEGPNQYGRIVRDAGGSVARIVEWRDATPEERDLREVNSGILVAPAADLRRWVPQLAADNAQGEFYLTDIVALARAEGAQVAALHPLDPTEVDGVNARTDLARLERIYQHRAARRLLDAGVQLADPARFDLRGTLDAGQDVFIDINCVIEGHVRLGDRVFVGPGCIIRNSTIGADTRIEAYSVIDGAEIDHHAALGPFARVRPSTRLGPHTRIGNFVEAKACVMGEGSKANHLSYIGDTDIGCHVNIGAGVITCNYDGVHKHRTTIGDHAFVGSDTQLVAPVTVGAGATIGAGSTITKDAPRDQLTLSRSSQKTVAGWRRPEK